MPRESPTACCGGLEDLLSPQLFKALSDPRRLPLLIRLAEAGEARTISAAPARKGAVVQFGGYSSEELGRGVSQFGS